MSISAKDFIALFKFDFTPRWICKDEDGQICVSDVKPSIFNDDLVWMQPGSYKDFPSVDIAEFADKDWTDCILEIKQPENPYEWIGYMCAFGLGESPAFGVLARIEETPLLKMVQYFMVGSDEIFYECRPVKEEEIKFYKGNNDGI